MLIGGGKKFINGHGNKRDENSSYVHNIARGVYRVTMKMDKDIENLLNIIKRYQSHFEGRSQSQSQNEVDTKEHEESEETLMVSFGKLLQTIQSHVEEPDFKKLNVNDMVHLENQLEASLDKIKSQRVEAMMENSSWIDNMDMAIAMVDSQL
ncbi:hypothetical protein SDJN03_12438, partial [Cucurbita argyrosperma subsp. sororia]